MPSKKIHSARVSTTLVVVWLTVILTVSGFGEQLPLRLFTSADGLASSAVTNVFRDSDGFIWFSTRDGLSRFDGREFQNFRLGDSSAAMTFWAFHETAEGIVWISTSDGLFRLDRNRISASAEVAPTGDPIRLPAEKVASIAPNFLFEDSRKRLWGGAGDLYLISENGEVRIEKVDLGPAARGNRQNPNSISMTETSDGNLWIACIAGVGRILTSGQKLFYPIDQLSDYAGGQAIVADNQDRIWIVHSNRLFVFKPENQINADALPDLTVRPLSLTEQKLGASGDIKLPLRENSAVQLVLEPQNPADAAGSQLNSVFKSSEGKIWITAGADLFIAEEGRYRRLRDTNGFADWTGRIAEDVNGDLWIGTTGVLRLSRAGMTSFGKNDGLARSNIQSIREGPDGSIYVLHGIDWSVAKITDAGLETAKFRLPETAKMLWTSNAAIIDRRGVWWALAENGLYRFREADIGKNTGLTPADVYTAADGLKGTSLYCAFEDSKGYLWFSTRGREDASGLTRYDPSNRRFQWFGAADGFPEGRSPVSFAEDKDGGIWFGLYNGGLIRFLNGRFTDFSTAGGFPQGGIFGLYADEKNRLWIGSARDGVAMIENAASEKPVFRRFTTREGLISNNIRTLTGDLEGNIYAGTVRGVSRISPESGNIRHFTTADGLAADFVTASFRDSRGTLWFGTADGVSRLVPGGETRRSGPPKIWIKNLTIAGNRVPLSPFGQVKIDEIAVGAADNNLQIEFLSVGAAIRFQYKLEGAENSEWSAPTEEKTVNFANLAPDSYRFLVRAVDEFGQTSEPSAVLNLRINPPFYRSWWFLAAVAVVVATGIFTLDRYRVSKTRQIQVAYDELRLSETERREAEDALQKSREERLAELERVRTRIASDLHDDIGASLTQIAVLSQAAHSQVSGENARLDSPLERIATVSVELVASMSDIVWAINPRKDNFRDLVQRMRRFAADVFTAKNVTFSFDAPDIDSTVQLGANIRREVFAIYKEAVTNAVKHSGCRHVVIAMNLCGDWLQLRITDDGRGFDSGILNETAESNSLGGNGLLNIRKRCNDLGGRYEIITSPGNGVTVKLEVPLHPSSESSVERR